MSKSKPIVIGKTCDKGDPLVFRFKPRERNPYNGADSIACNICEKEAVCYRGYYCCKNADKDCNYDVCNECYKGIKTFKLGVTCPGGNPLSLRNWDADAATCDVCDKDIEFEDGFY